MWNRNRFRKLRRSNSDLIFAIVLLRTLFVAFLIVLSVVYSLPFDSLLRNVTTVEAFLAPPLLVSEKNHVKSISPPPGGGEL